MDKFDTVEDLLEALPGTLLAEAFSIYVQMHGVARRGAEEARQLKQGICAMARSKRAVEKRADESANLTGLQSGAALAKAVPVIFPGGYTRKVNGEQVPFYTGNEVGQRLKYGTEVMPLSRSEKGPMPGTVLYHSSVPGAGLGTFALESVKKGQQILYFGGQIIDERTARRYQTEGRSVFVAKDQGFGIYPLSPTENAHDLVSRGEGACFVVCYDWHIHRGSPTRRYNTKLVVQHSEEQFPPHGLDCFFPECKMHNKRVVLVATANIAPGEELLCKSYLGQAYNERLLKEIIAERANDKHLERQLRLESSQTVSAARLSHVPVCACMPCVRVRALLFMSALNMRGQMFAASACMCVPCASMCVCLCVCCCVCACLMHLSMCLTCSKATVCRFVHMRTGTCMHIKISIPF
jgi:hypothetical protein